MFDLILFLLIISLTAMFIYFIAPIINKSISKTDIDKILTVIHRVSLFVEETTPHLTDIKKKELIIHHATEILKSLDISIDNSIIEIFVESEFYLIKNKESSFQ